MFDLFVYQFELISQFSCIAIIYNYTGLTAGSILVSHILSVWDARLSLSIYRNYEQLLYFCDVKTAIKPCSTFHFLQKKNYTKTGI